VAGDATGISAGRVGRAHGLDGSCHVTHPNARLLALGTAATVGGERREIVRRAGTDANPIVRFDGVASREAADALRGQEILVARTELPALEEGEWWAHELEGCTVVAAHGTAVTEEGEREGDSVLGVVRRLVELPSCEALEVVGAAGGEALLVPMVRDAVRSVDVQRRLIEVDAAFLDVRGEPGGRSP
jgi:16S rRNA processing protein RimM